MIRAKPTRKKRKRTQRERTGGQEQTADWSAKHGALLMIRPNNTNKIEHELSPISPPHTDTGLRMIIPTDDHLEGGVQAGAS